METDTISKNVTNMKSQMNRKNFYLPKVVFTVFLFAVFGINTNAQMKIGVINFKARAGVSSNDVDGVSSIFGTYFINPQKFTLVERSQIDNVINEQGFQYSSLTENQAVKLGEILNLSKIVIGDVSIIGGQYNVDVRIVNVQTGAVEATDGATWTGGTSYRELMKNLAFRLMAKIDYTQLIQPTINKQAVDNRVITLLGYLKIYPEDLGQFTEYPASMINALNNNNSYGINNWRLPTIEELRLIRENMNKIEGIKREVLYFSSEKLSYTEIKEQTYSEDVRNPQNILNCYKLFYMAAGEIGNRDRNGKITYYYTPCIGSPGYIRLVSTGR